MEKKRKNAVRTMITVPFDLKERMGQVTEEVNWSLLACQAFEKELGKIATLKKVKTMTDVLTRLRATKLEEADADYADGAVVGHQFATDDATAGELKRLKEWRDSMTYQTPNWDWMFSEESEAAGGWGLLVILACEILGEEYDREGSIDFWERVLGDREDRRLDSPQFLRGFAESAIQLWESLANEV